MNEERVVITLSEDGTFNFETHNMVGEVCESVAEQIMVGIGAQETEGGRKSSFYEDGDNPISVLTEA